MALIAERTVRSAPARRLSTPRLSTPRLSTPRLSTPRLVIAGVMFAGVLAIIVARWLTGTGYLEVPFGLPDPGALTSVGLPLTQYFHEVAGVAVVGLLFLRCLAFRDDGAPGCQHLAVTVARWGWVWVASTVVWVIFTLSDLSGLPAWALPSNGELVMLVLQSDRILAEVATLWVALAVALFGNRLSGLLQPVAFGLLATAGLLPSSLSGHAGHHSSPEVAVVAMGVHLVAAAIWVGGLLAMVAHLRKYPDLLRSVLPKFSAAALVCVLAIGGSGVVASIVSLETWSALWASDRGQLILAKTAALIVLSAVGYLHRSRTMHAAASGRLAPLLRLAGSELLLMGVTVGLGVALSTTA